MKTYFVTGTGTGIGKTYISALLAKAAVRAGLRTAVMKPVQTGMTDPADGDLGEIRRKVPQILDIPSGLACPYCLAYEASPHLAAEKESVEIDFAYIRECYDRIVKEYAPDVVFLEGAGGICVPVSAGVLTAELIKYLDFEVIIVAPAGLGSINHTLLSLEYLRNRDIRIAGVILNQFSIPPTEIELDNIRMIESFGRVRILAKASDGAAEFSECRLFEK